MQGNVINDHELTNESVTQDVLRWESHIEHTINKDTAIPETERETIVMARRGQGRFKINVRRYENKCRITGVDKIEHLVASHCKPWCDCQTHEERLDGENGLLLTPTIDHLFNRGFISFEGNSKIFIANAADTASLSKMGVSTHGQYQVGSFTEGQKAYLEYHRENLFLAANL